MRLVLRRFLPAVLATTLVMTLLGSPAAAAPAFRDRAYTTRPNPDVVMRGSGWGHGVGMSQYGAYAMALAGHNFVEILKHYYRGISVGEGRMPDSVRVGLGSSTTYSYVTAVNGDVPWRACGGGSCRIVRTQPEGSTWQVTLLYDGRYRLKRGSTVLYRGGAGQVLRADFNPAGRTGGTVIRAQNPNGDPRRYKWGRLEFIARSASARTMYVVLDIPEMQLYLRGLGEVPSSWGVGGIASLKAQAVAARTYALKMHQSSGSRRGDCLCTLLATPANQAYTGYDKETEPYGQYWVEAVRDTAGRVAKYDGLLISTFYSSSHGGRSENVQDSWAYGTTAVPYLRSVSDPWSLRAPGNSLRSWSRTVSNGAFSSFLGGDIARVRTLRIAGRTDGGSPLNIRASGVTSGGRIARTTRTGPKGIVGISMRSAFSYPAFGLSTLPSQQVRRLGFEPFIDDDGSYHEYKIVYAVRAGIMDRRSATRFGPGGVVPRRRAALYLWRMFDIPRATRDFYSDDEGLFEEHAINAIAQAGFSRRTENFRPHDAVRRGEVAMFIRRALDLPNASRDYFSDDNSSIYESAINAVAAKGLIPGCGGGRFCPSARFSRVSMAALLYRTVEAYR